MGSPDTLRSQLRRGCNTRSLAFRYNESCEVESSPKFVMKPSSSRNLIKSVSTDLKLFPKMKGLCPLFVQLHSIPNNHYGRSDLIKVFLRNLRSEIVIDLSASDIFLRTTQKPLINVVSEIDRRPRYENLLCLMDVSINSYIIFHSTFHYFE